MLSQTINKKRQFYQGGFDKMLTVTGNIDRKICVIVTKLQVKS